MRSLVRSGVGLCAVLLLGQQPQRQTVNAYSFVAHRRSLSFPTLTATHISPLHENHQALYAFPWRQTAEDTSSSSETNDDKNTLRKKLITPFHKIWQRSRPLLLALTEAIRRFRGVLIAFAVGIAIWANKSSSWLPKGVSSNATDPTLPSIGKGLALGGAAVLANELYKRSKLEGEEEAMLEERRVLLEKDDVFSGTPKALSEVDPDELAHERKDKRATLTQAAQLSTTVKQEPRDVTTKDETTSAAQDTIAEASENDADDGSSAALRTPTIQLQRTAAGSVTGEALPPKVYNVASLSKVPPAAAALPVIIPPAHVAKTTSPKLASNQEATRTVQVAVATPSSADLITTPVPVRDEKVAASPAKTFAAQSSAESAPEVAAIPAGKTSSSSSKTASPLIVMGFGNKNETAMPTKAAEDNASVDTLAVSATKRNSVQHETLRLLGFGSGSSASTTTPSVAMDREPSFKGRRQPWSKDTALLNDPSSSPSSTSSSTLGTAVLSVDVAEPVIRQASQPKPFSNTRIIQQPRPPHEESALQEKYAAIEDLEERAYQILKDLGMFL
jgi:hypothetical protein